MARPHLKRKRVEVDTLEPVTLPLPSATPSSPHTQAVVLVTIPSQKSLSLL